MVLRIFYYSKTNLNRSYHWFKTRYTIFGGSAGGNTDSIHRSHFGLFTYDSVNSYVLNPYDYYGSPIYKICIYHFNGNIIDLVVGHAGYGYEVAGIMYHVSTLCGLYASRHINPLAENLGSLLLIYHTMEHASNTHYNDYMSGCTFQYYTSGQGLFYVVLIAPLYLPTQAYEHGSPSFD